MTWSTCWSRTRSITLLAFRLTLQVKELGTKEILLIRLQPTSDSEAVSYNLFFEYLQSRKRFAVVGNASKNVKDCYVLPLGPKVK